MTNPRQQVEATTAHPPNRFFVQLKGFGLVGPEGKTVIALESSIKRIIAPADGPLALVVAILEQWHPMWRYSNQDSALQDVERLKRFVDSLSAE